MNKTNDKEETPRTDECFERHNSLIRQYGVANGVGPAFMAGNPFHLARQLERELAEAKRLGELAADNCDEALAQAEEAVRQRDEAMSARGEAVEIADVCKLDGCRMQHYRPQKP